MSHAKNCYRALGASSVVDELAALFWSHDLRTKGHAYVSGQALQALERWIGLGLPYEEANSRLFDNFEVYSFAVASALAGDDATWTRQFVGGHRHMVNALPTSAKVEIDFRRTINFAGRQRPGFAHVRLPLPFEDDAQRDLRVVVSEPAAQSSPCVIEPGRLSLKVQAPTTDPPWVVVSARYSLNVRCPEPVDPALIEPTDPSFTDTELYTRETEPGILVTDSIKTLAATLSNGLIDRWAIVMKLRDFFFDRMRNGYIHYALLSAVDPLTAAVEAGWADCYVGSCLLIAMCRAMRIPARLVSGYLIYPLNPSIHYWPEIRLPPFGWVPIDVAHSWTLAAGDKNDSFWANRFIGQSDLRLKTQCFPRMFTGNAGISLPSRWRMLQRRDGDAAEIAYYACGESPNTFLYSDRIAVTQIIPSVLDLPAEHTAS